MTQASYITNTFIEFHYWLQGRISGMYSYDIGFHKHVRFILQQND